VELCQRHETLPAETEKSSEDTWFDLLRSQLEMVQSVVSSISSVQSPIDDPLTTESVDQLRQILQDTFSQLVSQASAQKVSFPRLFERLVDSTATSRSSKSGFYAEFRLILTGMLESYRFEGDFLTLNNRLVEQDLFETISANIKARSRGWRAPTPYCVGCQKSLELPAVVDSQKEGDSAEGKVTIFRSGMLYHAECLSLSSSISL